MHSIEYIIIMMHCTEQCDIAFILVDMYHETCFTSQGRSHNSLSGQVGFVPSLSDFRIRAIEIFSYECFETQNYLKLECLMACLHRKFGLSVYK